MKGITIKEAAQILELTTTRVNQLIYSGKLNGTKFGSVWMLDEDEVRDFKGKPKEKGGRPRKKGTAEP